MMHGQENIKRTDIYKAYFIFITETLITEP